MRDIFLDAQHIIRELRSRALASGSARRPVSASLRAQRYDDDAPEIIQNMLTICPGKRQRHRLFTCSQLFPMAHSFVSHILLSRSSKGKT
jgi:hypothetical protein